MARNAVKKLRTLRHPGVIKVLDTVETETYIYIATERLPHGQPLPPKRGPMPKNADAKSRMTRKLRSKAESAIYAQRKAIVEPVNGQIKEARGLRRFLLRGLEKVDEEWHLIAATHNLLKLVRALRRRPTLRLVPAGSPPKRTWSPLMPSAPPCRGPSPPPWPTPRGRVPPRPSPPSRSSTS